MKKRVYVVDTSGLIALTNARDQYRANAVRVRERLDDENWKCFLSEWVLSEYLNGAAKFRVRAQAMETVADLIARRDVHVVPANHQSWSRAFELYRSRRDKDWSHTDYTIIDFCRSKQITHIFSSDHHFEQAGLVPMIVSPDW